MIRNDAAIGVMDSGVGGLTVARELLRLLPQENLLYFGDSANCPYGNKTAEQIFDLSCGMLRYFDAHGVKCVAAACNTISTLAERLRPCFSFPIISIVEAAAQSVAARGLHRVGLIGTEFTVRSGKYNELIRAADPTCEVIGCGSPYLAELVDSGDFGSSAVDAEIRARVDTILQGGAVETLILGCTHYPIVEPRLRALYPTLPLLNPSAEQARAVGELLRNENACNPADTGTFSLCTTGDPEIYLEVIDRLGMRRPDRIERVAP